jgi:single-stranded-DNA-specific exonuclease
MDRAVSHVREAIRAGVPIVVYGDFDADGITATALLVLTLRSLGGETYPYIPHRVDEGYGLNRPALTELARKGARLVITVDCGIRSPEEVAHARRLGMDVIITDHHTLGPRVPEAVAVLNPRRPDCPYPYEHLTGVGLAYKLAQALLRANRQVPLAGSAPLEEEDLLDLVALGTVADLAPLTGENRALVIRGLERLNTAPRPGLDALMRLTGVHQGQVSATTIGYVLAPRLNAAGRIAHAKIAYQLLTAQYPGEAEHLARQLDELNRQRQQLTAEALEKARAAVLAEGIDRPLLFVADPSFPPGVVGLVASRLAEEFYRPAVVVEQGVEESRGSARSIPEFHITQALDRCTDLLLRYGGHRAAAGFTVRTADLPELKARLTDLAEEALRDVDLTPTLEVDAEVPLREMNGQVWKALQDLRPFGEGNPEPLFASRHVRVRHQRAVGSDGAHLKLLLSDGNTVWDGIAFRQGDWADHLPDYVDIAYHLQVNEFRGERRLQLNIQDVRPVW